MESAKDANKKDDAILPSKYRGPQHTLINAMHDKVDELVNASNSITVGSNTTISFGDMISTTKKGVTTYSIVMTVTNGGVSKTITHTLT